MLEKIDDYFPTYTALERLSNDERAAIKLGQIRDTIIKLITQATIYYDANGYSKF